MKSAEVEWREVKDFEGVYWISSNGDVRSLAKKKEKILKPFTDKLGRKQFFLWKGDRKRYVRGHVLVAEGFIPNPLNKKCVNHIDNNPSNNNINNLEWCTSQENTDHMMRQKRNRVRIGEESKNSVLKESEVIKIIKLSKYKTCTDIAIEINRNRTTVWDVITNKSWKHIKR